MVRAVQASLLHSNSSHAQPRHHLYPKGKASWCKWQVAQALGKPYQHHKPPIPEAIVQLLKPIYARLGSCELLEKCLGGYTQNANESLHSTVWKFCPKELFLGKSNVEIACALAVCNFNDGASSLVSVTESLNLKSTSLCTHFLKSKGSKRASTRTLKGQSIYDVLHGGSVKDLMINTSKKKGWSMHLVHLVMIHQDLASIQGSKKCISFFI